MPQLSRGPAIAGATGPGAPAGKSPAATAVQKLRRFPGPEFCLALLCFKSLLQGQVSVCPSARGICVLADKRKAVN